MNIGLNEYLENIKYNEITTSDTCAQKMLKSFEDIHIMLSDTSTQKNSEKFKYINTTLNCLLLEHNKDQSYKLCKMAIMENGLALKYVKVTFYCYNLLYVLFNFNFFVII